MIFFREKREGRLGVVDLFSFLLVVDASLGAFVVEETGHRVAGAPMIGQRGVHGRQQVVFEGKDLQHIVDIEGNSFISRTENVEMKGRFLRDGSFDVEIRANLYAGACHVDGLLHLPH